MDCTAESLHQPSFENNTTPNPFNHADNIKTKAIMAEAKAWAKNSDINWEDPCCIDLAARIEIIFHRNMKKLRKRSLLKGVGTVVSTTLVIASTVLAGPGIKLVSPSLIAKPLLRLSNKIALLNKWRKILYAKITIPSDEIDCETPMRLIDIFDKKYGIEIVRNNLLVDENKIFEGVATIGLTT
mmetsp:Transcript_1687/g.3608  ORF Transcript_1687/g.3608 Transcript_1687/m.3608 type:complete len:184 (+) Transcript_1687:336-887(+)